MLIPSLVKCQEEVFILKTKTKNKNKEKNKKNPQTGHHFYLKIMRATS